MAYTLNTIKRLYAKSGNQCAYPECTSPIIVQDVQVGEVCHIKARNKKGPRYDPNLSQKEKDSFSNLMLLCRTCHKLIDSKPETYTVDLLKEIKEMHERKGDSEITPQIAKEALLLMPVRKTKNVKAVSGEGGVSIAIGGDSNGPITVQKTGPKREPKSKYPDNAIGSDANLSGYVDYLFGKAVDYWKNVEAMTPGRLGKKLKNISV